MAAIKTAFDMLYPKRLFLSAIVLTLALFHHSCNKEEVDTEERRDVATQYLEDDEALINYLKSHFYNYEDFLQAPDDYSLRIQIDTIAGENANKTSLYEQIKSKSIDVLGSNDEIIAHNLYYIVVREGKGEHPSVVDSTFVRYRGNLLDGSVFDNTELPVWFNLPEVVVGFRESLPELGAGRFEENQDGTFTFFDYGQGLIFMPSALGYYSRAQSGIPSYSPLVFSISLFTMKATDHDGDSILSRDEDVDGDGNPFDDDTDDDGRANMYDSDDDGDGVLTRDEIDRDENGVPGDSDNDGIPNFLDPDSAS